jgi:hypothetical protein
MLQPQLEPEETGLVLIPETVLTEPDLFANTPTNESPELPLV